LWNEREKERKNEREESSNYPPKESTRSGSCKERNSGPRLVLGRARNSGRHWTQETVLDSF
jgi:hypothetical protein